MTKPRVVVCAANRLNIPWIEGTTKYKIAIGVRHFDMVMLEQMPKPLWSDYEIEQGFIDQFGLFMTREEAYLVAQAAGQIKYRCGGDEGVLYSENLY